MEFNTDECECNCSLILDQDESAWFESFERDVLRQGSTWFEIPLWVGGDLEYHRVRFKDRPQAGNLIGVHTTYTMTFDVSKRNLIDPCLALDLIDYQPADIREGAAMLCAMVETMGGCTNYPVGM